MSVLQIPTIPGSLTTNKNTLLVGTSNSESEILLFKCSSKANKNSLTGCVRLGNIASRISYFLKLNSLAITVDTACSSTLHALDQAFKAIKNGTCDAAIVGAAHLTLNPYGTLQFAQMGVLSLDGKCKTFDESANGYVRSETIGALFLQKSSDSKRIYAKIINCMSNCDGYKDEGIMFPSSLSQQQLLQSVYDEGGINIDDLTYIEAHGTGTKVGDVEEVAAIDEIIGKKRTKPLLIGSAKTYLGHSEPACGFGSLAKVILSMENELIPRNLHFSKPKAAITGIKEGRIKVVTENTPIPTDKTCIIGVSNFGFGGANSHVVLEWNSKFKGINSNKDALPRLVCISGRTKEAVKLILDDLEEEKMDVEYISLLHNIFDENVSGHKYRGSVVISHSGFCQYAIQRIPETKKQHIVFFGSFGHKWKVIAEQFLQFPIFCKSFNAIQKTLELEVHPDNCNISKLNKTDEIYGNFITLMSIASILINIKLTYDKVDGTSLGEIVSQYLIGTLTFKSAIQNFRKNYKLFAETQTNNDTFSINNYESNKAERKLDRLFENLNSQKGLQENKENFLIFNISGIQINKNQKIEINPKDGIGSFLRSLGDLHSHGFNFHVKELYPQTQFPVSRGTRMISPLIKWHHENDWYYYNYKLSCSMENHNCSYNYGINVQSDYWKFISGHVVDGKVLFPATGYLFMVWEKFCYSKNMTICEPHQITFRNCRFVRATPVPKKGEMTFHITFLKSCNTFEIFENNSLVVSGEIYLGCEQTDYEYQSNSKLIMSKKDIYKELRLRGYNYKNEFTALEESSLDGTNAMVTFTGNWVAFLDNMLQIKVLQKDSRKLYVPTMFQKLTIDNAKHASSQKFGKNGNQMKLSVDPCTKIIKSGGVEIQGLNAQIISRRNPKRNPVLEIHKFIPNFSSQLVSLEEAVRVNIDVILENSGTKSIKIVEVLLESEFSVSNWIYNIFNDRPLIKPDITVVTKKQLELENPNINISYKDITSIKDFDLLVGYNILQDKQNLENALGAISRNGFILSFEKLLISDSSNVNILTKYIIGSLTSILFARKTTPMAVSNLTPINITNKSMEWLITLQKTVSKTENVILFSNNEPESGILGFVNCLRREPGWERTKCIFVMDLDAPKFDLNNLFYKKQLKTNMTINIYKNGAWGTYRHLIMSPLTTIKLSNVIGSQLVKGDLSSLQWIQAPIMRSKQLNETDVNVSYAAINFKDIMTATGRIHFDKLTRIQQENLEGFEYSGIEVGTGKKIAGMLESGALQHSIIADKEMSFYLPDSWSLADGATVTSVYGTVLYSLLHCGKLKEGQSILIHSGTGGIGLAAITVSLYYKCTVFVTVGTKEKREFLKKHYPSLKDSHIGNSRDVSFETMIKKETHGRGVDLVLNSLVEEKLIASVRCLADNGKFLEIGKFDLMRNNTLQLLLLHKSASYYGVMLEMFKSTRRTEILRVFNLIKSNIANGCVKPLSRTIFPMSQLQEAFRYMTSGTHIGKVIVNMMDNEKKQKYECIPRFYCDPNKCQIIIGGLGGFGLELADWLVLRGAKNIILSSRNGITKGYQSYRIKCWKDLGAQINVVTYDVTTTDGCKQLLEEANSIASVESIFNVAVVLKDAIFENQSENTFNISLGPKAEATIHLDKLTRELCPTLKNFVVFSSLSCGRGNAGQTNYGMSNSIMERIVENRKRDGLHGLAIQWGAIGDVGIVADMVNREDVNIENEIEIEGTLQQSIASCLLVMDTFLSQDEPVVASMVLADKNIASGANDNIVAAVSNLLGIKDMKTISMHSTLPELGMNSISAVEIKQTLERDFGFNFSLVDIRSLTFAKLQELQECLERPIDNDIKIAERAEIQQDFLDLSILFATLGDEAKSTLKICKLKTILDDTDKGTTVILFPGIEGIASSLENMARNIKAHAYGVQYNSFPENVSIEQISDALLPDVEAVLPERTFNFVVHSYGCTIGFEIAAKLEDKGYTGNIISIDSSIDFVKSTTEHLLGNIPNNELETRMVCHAIYIAMKPTNETMIKIKKKITDGKTIDERLDIGVNTATKILAKEIQIPYSLEYMRRTLNSIIFRTKNVKFYQPTYSKLKSPVKLVKPSQKIIQSEGNISYGLEKYFLHVEDAVILDGDHLTVLNSVETLEVINDKLST